MTARFTLEMPDELLARVDEARGDVPRNRWLRRAVEQALGEGVPGVGQLDDNQMSPERKDGPGRRGTAGTTPGRRADSNAVSSAPAERPRYRAPGDGPIAVREPRPVRPYPKQGKR